MRAWSVTTTEALILLILAFIAGALFVLGTFDRTAFVVSGAIAGLAALLILVIVREHCPR